MNFEVKNKIENEDYFEITKDKKCLDILKKTDVKSKRIWISFDNLNLGVKLYGNTKEESISLQKDNCRKILKFYSNIKKTIKYLIKRGFDGSIFIDRLPEKKNNNDIMLLALLEVDFNTKYSKKMRRSYEFACDWFDAENSLNNMCDFRDNHCTKHREKGIDKTTGCCPSFCKIRVAGQACKHKNLSCKIFMCDYLINEKGYYFTPNTVPILKKHFSMLERFVMFGNLCRNENKSLNFIKMVRCFRYLYYVVLFYILMIIIF